MLKIRKSELAKEDLIKIWFDGYYERGEQQADFYLGRLEEKINSLLNFPEKYRLRKQFNPPIRIYPHKSHLVIYTMKTDEILIVRVLPSQMKIEERI
jgi:toxin ParE1/3/4